MVIGCTDGNMVVLMVVVVFVLMESVVVGCIMVFGG